MIAGVAVADDLLTAKDVASKTRVDLGTFYRWCRRGIGPKAIQIGGAIRYRASDVAQWLADRARPVKKPTGEGGGDEQ
jgi:predicted DNA-binding transcriptional regulator AlpA